MASGETHTSGSERTRSGPRLAYLIAAGALIVVAFIAIGIAALAIRSHDELPEVVLTLLLIFGIVVLLTTIAALVVLMAGFDLTTNKEALGLPSGSVRAVLALGLLLVFAIVSVFLFWNTGHDVVESTGITQDQLSLLPKDRIVAIRATGTTFSVDVAAGTALSDQLAQQLLTILGTLLTAVAAFYFGASSVSAAYRSSRAAPAVEATVTTAGGGATAGATAGGAGSTGGDGATTAAGAATDAGTTTGAGTAPLPSTASGAGGSSGSTTVPAVAAGSAAVSVAESSDDATGYSTIDDDDAEARAAMDFVPDEAALAAEADADPDPTDAEPPPEPEPDPPDDPTGDDERLDDGFG